MLRSLLSYSSVAFLFWASASAFGAESISKEEELKSNLLTSASLGNSIWQMALGLLMVLAVIFLLAWLMRRVTGIQGSRQHIKILSAINVGSRERAVLVEVGGEQLLLGVASGQVNLLHKLTHPIENNDRAADFSSSLQKAAEKLKKESVKPRDNKN